MVVVQIIIDQVSKIAGAPGESRSDLDINKEITLSNYDNTGIEKFEWEIISWATDLNSPNTVSPTLNNYDGYEATFTPIIAGSYLIQLKANDFIIGRVIASIRTSFLDIRLPAEEEKNEFDGGWEWNLIDIIKIIEASIENSGTGATSSSTFIGLTDTPSSYEP